MLLSSELAAGIEGGDEIFRGSLPPPVKSVPEEITVVQKMLSACLGSLLTSLVVTPFDVIRVRIQQQEVLPKECCSVPDGPTLSARNTLQNMPAAQLSHTPNEPFWINKSYCKASPDCTKITSTYQGIVCILRNEGISTLWRGLSITLFMTIPSNIIYFTGYEYIRDHSFFPNHPLNPLLCGSLARTMAATVISPFELIKTRLQSIPADRTGKRNNIARNLIRDMYATARANGLGTLFKGLKITLWRDVPFSGIYWSCYETFKLQFGLLLKADFSSQNTASSEDWRIFATSFLSGSLAGTVAALCTNAFDVGKTRLQIATEASPHIKGRRPSMFLFLYDIYKAEGIGALYTGIGPRVLKIAPACAIMISSYEVGKKLFRNRQ